MREGACATSPRRGHICLYLSISAAHSIMLLGCLGQPRARKYESCFSVGGLFSMPVRALLAAKCLARAALRCSRTCSGAGDRLGSKEARDETPAVANRSCSQSHETFKTSETGLGQEFTVQCVT